MVRTLGLMLLLLFSTASASNLDSTEAIRGQVYSLMGLDTTGTNNLPTNIVDDYVHYGIRQVNNDLGEYTKTELLTTTDGSRYIVLDSVVRLVGCQYVSGDSSVGLRPINSEDIVDSLYSAETISDDDKIPQFVYVWGDSLGVAPTPVATDDTLQVHYIHVIPQDSIGRVRENDRTGVVYWAAFLASMDISSGKAEMFLQLYDKFVASRLK